MHKIFELCSPKGQKIVEVEPFVSLEGFKLDAFDKSSIFYLSSIHDKENESLKSSLRRMDLVRCPRVGLTLKRYDEQKERFWMADYRFLTYPSKNKKYNIFFGLSMIKDRVPLNTIEVRTKIKKSTLEELNSQY